MEAGVNIEGYLTKKCKVIIVNDFTFRIILTEGKKTPNSQNVFKSFPRSS